MFKDEIHFAYDTKGNHKTIYMRYYEKQHILELHSDKGIPIQWFMTIKNRLKIMAGDSIELRVV